MKKRGNVDTKQKEAARVFKERKGAIDGAAELAKIARGTYKRDCRYFLKTYLGYRGMCAMLDLQFHDSKCNDNCSLMFGGGDADGEAQLARIAKDPNKWR